MAQDEMIAIMAASIYAANEGQRLHIVALQSEREIRMTNAIKDARRIWEITVTHPWRED